MKKKYEKASNQFLILQENIHIYILFLNKMFVFVIYINIYLQTKNRTDIHYISS